MWVAFIVATIVFTDPFARSSTTIIGTLSRTKADDNEENAMIGRTATNKCSAFNL